jgi:serine/threonine protein kinase
VRVKKVDALTLERINVVPDSATPPGRYVGSPAAAARPASPCSQAALQRALASANRLHPRARPPHWLRLLVLRENFYPGGAEARRRESAGEDRVGPWQRWRCAPTGRILCATMQPLRLARLPHDFADMMLPQAVRRASAMRLARSVHVGLRGRSSMNPAPESRSGGALSDLGRRLNEIQQIGDVTLRIIEYKGLVEEFPNASLAAFNLAVDLWNSGRRDEASDAARRAIAIAPELLDRLPWGLAGSLRNVPAPSSDNPIDRLGQVVAGFRITHCIAEDPRTLLYQVERDAVRGYLRVLRPVLSQDPSVTTRFLTSAELLRRTQHPSLVTILDTGTLPDGCAYLIMRPEPGEPLSERIWRKELLAPLAPALRGLAEALATLHAQGLCYLSIQPERLQVTAGAKPAMQLLDSEHVRGEALQLPAPTIAEGVVRKGVDPVLFMAPESFSGRTEVGPPADVYELGVLAYFVLCERLPFVGEREGEVIAAHLNQPPVPVRSLAPNVSEELARLVEAMLDKDPNNRPAMARVAEDLARLFAPPASEAFAEQVGDYRLVRKIGEGRTGQVFEAYNERIRRHDAIKLIRPELCRSQEDAERFLLEVQAANQVAHPGIISIIQQARTPSGQIYTVMEYLSGGSLRDRIKHGPLPPQQVQQLCRHVALAVAAAHEHGVIHRDIKPENVLVMPDPDVPGGERTKVVDFGTANLTTSHARGPYVEGTPPYMSPEQLRDTGTTGAKTDVFALGVMMNEMLAGGWRPGQPRSPAGCPRRLGSLIQRMQDPDPNMRPTMQYVADALAVPEDPFPWRRARIPAVIVGVAGAAMLVGLHQCPETYKLTVEKTGVGTVTVAETGSDCDAECGEPYARGALVTLTATPASTSVFGGWIGCDSTSGTSCTVTMNDAKTVTAAFLAPSAYKLIVVKTGSGTVTASGIDCGDDCGESYASGTQVTLTETPKDAWVLERWNGCDSTSATTCTVTMSATKTVTAAFVPTYKLTVAKTGTGTVTASGASCGSDCGSYPAGAVVALTATAKAPFVFGGWTGCEPATSATCRVTMNEAKAVTAAFVPTYKLTIDKTGAGKASGVVTTTGTSPGISCGSNCREAYPKGTVVELTATATSPAAFGSWAGCEPATSATCRVTVDAAKKVTASFDIVNDSRCVAGNVDVVETRGTSGWLRSSCDAWQGCTKTTCRAFCDLTAMPTHPTYCVVPSEPGEHAGDGWLKWLPADLVGEATIGHWSETEGRYVTASRSTAGNLTWPYTWHLGGSDIVRISFKPRRSDPPPTPIFEFRAKGYYVNEQHNGYRIRLFKGVPSTKDDTASGGGAIAQCEGNSVPLDFARRCSFGPPNNAELDYSGGWNTMELSVTGAGSLDVNWVKLTLQP